MQSQINSKTQVPIGWVLTSIGSLIACTVFIVSAVFGVEKNNIARFDEIDGAVMSVGHKVDLVKAEYRAEVAKATEDRQRIWKAIQANGAGRWTRADEIQKAELDQARNPTLKIYIPPQSGD